MIVRDFGIKVRAIILGIVPGRGNQNAAGKARYKSRNVSSFALRRILFTQSMRLDVPARLPSPSGDILYTLETCQFFRATFAIASAGGYDRRVVAFAKPSLTAPAINRG